MRLTIESHPSLVASAFTTTFPEPLGGSPSPAWLLDFLRLDAPSPLQRSEPLRGAVRDMLRHGGFKPTGRGKPASEYLIRAAEEGGIRSINVAVDACNATSLHSGFPISVVDVELAHEPFRIAVASPGASYVFNPSGQEMDLGGLLCVFDAESPCANAVKDSQRTKTHELTRQTLSVVWGCVGFEDELARATDWYQELLTRASSAVCTPVG